MKITNLEDLQQVKDAGLASLYPPKPKILVGMATCGLAAGAQPVYDLLRRKAEAAGWDGVVEKTGCIGFCYKEPLVDLIWPASPRLTYELMTPKAVESFWEEMNSIRYPEKRLLGRIDVDEMLLDGGPRRLYRRKQLKGFLASVPLYEELDFFKMQRRLAMRNCGFIDPYKLEHYIARGGYAALYQALTAMTPEEVIEQIIASGLRGRGGGGFPTGVKWQS
jgi:hypothetical protein